jgi:hypothetical protein
MDFMICTCGLQWAVGVFGGWQGSSKKKISRLLPVLESGLAILPIMSQPMLKFDPRKF